MRLTKPLAMIFTFIGAFAGFLMRPSDMYGRQLPLSVVLTRGATLHHMSYFLLRSVADRSFDTMLLWLALGGLLGAIVGRLLDARRAQLHMPSSGPPKRHGPRPE